MGTRVLTAHVPDSLAQQVDDAAARLERPRGWIMKQALTRWLEQEERRNAMTLEGMADVDAGRVVDHQFVEDWANSLGIENSLPLPGQQGLGER